MTEIVAGADIEGYEFLEPIGQGGFANIWLVRSHKYNCKFVAKISRVADTDLDRAWAGFDAEIRALMRLDHPNIIKLYGHFRLGEDFVMILEHCPHGSLADYVKNRGPMHTGPLVQIVRDVSTALRYIWSQDVQHRDIKPANILLGENGRAKLVDFGISTCSSGSQITEFSCSTMCAAPEILNRVRHDPVKSDIWAFGITILWMANGFAPWNCATRDEMVNLIIYAQYTVPARMNRALLKIVKRMLKLNPEEREIPDDEEIGQISGAKTEMRRASVSNVSGTFNVGGMRMTPIMSQISADKRRGSGGSLCLSGLPRTSMLVGGGGSLGPKLPETRSQPSQICLRKTVPVQRKVSQCPKRGVNGRPIPLGGLRVVEDEC